MSLTWRGGCLASLAAMALLPFHHVEAAEFHRLDGLHRVAKAAQITAPAELRPRGGDDNVCSSSMKLCPSSLGGGCCPDNYDCAKQSCYATTKGPSTCGAKVGWHACAAIYGGGCCPDGYLCQAAGDCVPPSSMPYTLGCPASRYLCPSSLGYGCCPNGMGCGVNQCYSTSPSTATKTMTITTTQDGAKTTYTTTSATVITPTAPTSLPTGDSSDTGDVNILKYYPSAIAQVAPTSSPNSKSGAGGLSGAQLGGIIGGAIAFLIIVLVAAYIIIRHLNKVVAAVGDSQKSNPKPHPPMRQFKPVDSEADELSIDPLMLSPRPSYPRQGSMSEGQYGRVSPSIASTPGHAPTSYAGEYHSVAGDAASRHHSVDSTGQGGYFDMIPGWTGRFSEQSRDSRVSYDSLLQNYRKNSRHYSNASEVSSDADTEISRGPSELEGRAFVPELPGSPTMRSDSLRSNRRRSASGGGTAPAAMARPPVAHQRKRTDMWFQGRSQSKDAANNQLGVVSEEMHGFHGPAGKVAGQTAPRPASTSPTGSRASSSHSKGRGRDEGHI